MRAVVLGERDERVVGLDVDREEVSVARTDRVVAAGVLGRDVAGRRRVVVLFVLVRQALERVQHLDHQRVLGPVEGSAGSRPPVHAHVERPVAERLPGPPADDLVVVLGVDGVQDPIAVAVDHLHDEVGVDGPRVPDGRHEVLAHVHRHLEPVVVAVADHEVIDDFADRDLGRLEVVVVVLVPVVHAVGVVRMRVGVAVGVGVRVGVDVRIRVRTGVLVVPAPEEVVAASGEGSGEKQKTHLANATRPIAPPPWPPGGRRRDLGVALAAEAVSVSVHVYVYVDVDVEDSMKWLASIASTR